GLRLWDESEAGGSRRRLAAAWLALSLGLTMKITAAYALVPLVVAIVRPPRLRQATLATLTLVPAALWYLHASALLNAGAASRSSAMNVDLWLRNVSGFWDVPTATLGIFARHLLRKAFTPLGAALALWGAVWLRAADRLFTV